MPKFQISALGYAGKDATPLKSGDDGSHFSFAVSGMRPKDGGDAPTMWCGVLSYRWLAEKVLREVKQGDNILVQGLAAPTISDKGDLELLIQANLVEVCPRTPRLEDAPF